VFNTSRLALGAILSLGLAASASAETVIKIGHGTNEQFHMHRAMLKFEELVEAGSNGDIDIQIFPSSQMGLDREMIEGAQTGVLEMAIAPSSFFAGWDPAFGVIELPYMYPSKDVAFKVLHSSVGDQMLERLAALDLTGLGWMELGLRHVTNNTREIVAPADLEGIKLRTMKVPAHVDTFTALGANPTPMNFGEVYSALQQGVIDGEENPIAIIDSARFYEVQKYMSLTGHVFAVYIPVISKPFFDSLSPEYQKLIRESLVSATAYQQELINSEEAAQLDIIRAAGVTVTNLTPEQRQAFSDKTKDIRAKYRDEIGAEVFDTWLAEVAAESAK
jgi:tripartite ATP-independent transporter DctP family solute receptor